MEQRLSDLLVLASVGGTVVTWKADIEFAVQMTVAFLTGVAAILAIVRHVRAMRRERRARSNTEGLE